MVIRRNIVLHGKGIWKYSDSTRTTASKEGEKRVHQQLTWLALIFSCQLTSSTMFQWCVFAIQVMPGKQWNLLKLQLLLLAIPHYQIFITSWKRHGRIENWANRLNSPFSASMMQIILIQNYEISASRSQEGFFNFKTSFHVRWVFFHASYHITAYQRSMAE